MVSFRRRGGDAVTRRSSSLAEDSKSVIVCLHHGTGSRRSWNTFEERFEGREIYAYDREGFGSHPINATKWNAEYHREGANELLEILKEIVGPDDDRGVVLVGHSDGATIGLLAAAKDKRNIVRGVVAEAPHVYHGSRYETPYGADGGFDYFKRTVMDTQRERIRKAMAKEHRTRQRGDAVVRRWFDWWTDEANRTWDVSSCLPDVGCPVLVVHGENDIFYPRRHSELISMSCGREGGSNSEFVEIPSVGHEIHKENPESFMDTVDSWLRSNNL